MKDLMKVLTDDEIFQKLSLYTHYLVVAMCTDEQWRSNRRASPIAVLAMMERSKTTLRVCARNV